VLTTMENNHSKKTKEKNQQDLDNNYGNSWSFSQKNFWIQFEKKEIPSQIHLIMG
jgi:hypothetical protein